MATISLSEYKRPKVTKTPKNKLNGKIKSAIFDTPNTSKGMIKSRGIFPSMALDKILINF